MKLTTTSRITAATLAALLLLVGSAVLRAEEPEIQPPKVEAEMNAQAVMALAKARLRFYVVDARGPRRERLPGSKPLAPDATAAEIQRVLPAKASLVITYCDGPDCTKSQELAERLAQNGYASVIRFTDGVAGWTKAGYRLESDPPPRQQPPANPPPANPPRRGSGSRGSGSRR